MSVIDLDSRRPHAATEVSCDKCGKRWVAVHLADAHSLECPCCGNDVNPYGTSVLARRCKTCGSYFTVCPKPGDAGAWENCLSPQCASYDPGRDVDYLFPE